MPAGKFDNPLHPLIAEVAAACRNCGVCREKCEFLKRFGTPKEIADNFQPEDQDLGSVSFSCNLCRLCTAICPFGINPADFFLHIRQIAVGKNFDFSAHRRILRYEALGTSPLFSWYGLPERCSTVFFPGCTLPGSRPRQTLTLFQLLGKMMPDLGIVFDCCTKSSHDLGRMEHFHQTFRTLKQQLLITGIKTVITACPSCYSVFKTHGAPLNVITAYELLEKTNFSRGSNSRSIMAVHDPCATRFDTAIHSAVRRLLNKMGIDWIETPQCRERTLCCGEGGSVACQSPDLSKNTTRIAGHQANGIPLVTYCAGCAALLPSVAPTAHIVDLICAAVNGQDAGPKVYRSPLSYLNRLYLKWYLRRTLRVRFSATRRTRS